MDVEMADAEAASTVVPTPIPLPALPSIPAGPEDYSPYRNQYTPLIIDNGSTTLRWGFANHLDSSGSASATLNSDPRFGPNIIAKYRERRNNRPLVLFGDAIEVESGAKAQAKTPWEGDVLLNFDALENALDYAFVQLGIDTPTVDHPVFMTERLCSPVHSRALTSELMFEQYGVPSLTYCIDGVMSFYQNNQDSSTSSLASGNGYGFSADGIVVSFNTASTSVIPILNGKGILSHAKRIPWGASQSTDYLLKLIQVKYPTFPTRVSVTQSNWMLRTFCSVSPDYTSLLRSFHDDPSLLRASESIIQFPFGPRSTPTGSTPGHGGEEKTEEELAKISEKRREQGRKLQEIARKNREEKLLQKESDLTYLLTLRESGDSMISTNGMQARDRNWKAKLDSEGFEDTEALDNMIRKLDADIKKARKKEAEKDLGKDGGLGMDVDEEEPTFPLVDVPDAELSEGSLKEKRKQKLLKAGFESRKLKAEEKEREREEKEREERKEEEERERDLEGWAGKLKEEQEVLMTRIKDRARRKAALSDRKSAAAQARMKSIANLAAASDEKGSGAGTSGKKKRKGGGEDLFGADDADWAIYRKINTTTVSSDEEEDLAQLHLIEQKLLSHDPTFTSQHTHASLSAKRSRLLEAFKPGYDEGDLEGKTRIHLNTERWRACEAWFQPGIAGVDSAGLGEVIQNVLAGFAEQEKGRLVKNIFLTGSPSLIPGLAPRLYTTLRPLLPPEMKIEIRRAEDPGLDAWRGMARFANALAIQNQTQTGLNSVGMTKAEYEEYGGERIKRWWGGNWNGGY